MGGAGKQKIIVGLAAKVGPAQRDHDAIRIFLILLQGIFELEGMHYV